MEEVVRNVAEIDAADRQALEHLLGERLAEHQQVIVSIVNINLAESRETPAAKPAQTLDDWTRVYDGLSDEVIEDLDKVVKTRANLTRYLNLP
jgi:hypothetical protein